MDNNINLNKWLINEYNNWKESTLNENFEIDDSLLKKFELIYDYKSLVQELLKILED